jgi:hypothetical protein
MKKKLPAKGRSGGRLQIQDGASGCWVTRKPAFTVRWMLPVKTCCNASARPSQYNRIAMSKCQVRRISMTSNSRASAGENAG